MISLGSEKIFEILGFPITNTLLTSWLVVFLLFIVLIILHKNLKEKPSKFQLLFELFLENPQAFFMEILGENFNIKTFTFILTFFVFILFSNWLGVFPGIGSIYLKENTHHLPLFRSTYSDLNMTLALALVSVIGTNILGVFHFGKRFLKKYLNPIGVLEIFGEFAKILSFSFRLFGNIFAGEVLLVIIGSLIAFLAPIPFLGLEIFVGFVQAVIFSVLTAIFLKVALSEH